MPLDYSNYKCSAYLFNELSNLSLFHIMKLRSDVFVVEQACIYPDLDNKDIAPKTAHLMVSANAQTNSSKDNPILAYARCLPPGLSYPHASIGRVLVSPDARNQGLGNLIVKKSIEYCRQQWPKHPIQIGAQLYLQDFYASHGFSTISEAYDEDGIQHIDMQL